MGCLTKKKKKRRLGGLVFLANKHSKKQSRIRDSDLVAKIRHTIPMSYPMMRNTYGDNCFIIIIYKGIKGKVVNGKDENRKKRTICENERQLLMNKNENKTKKKK